MSADKIREIRELREMLDKLACDMERAEHVCRVERAREQRAVPCPGCAESVAAGRRVRPHSATATPHDDGWLITCPSCNYSALASQVQLDGLTGVQR